MLAAVWIAVLSAMAVVSANPVVVNRAQTVAADAIVVGTWSPGAPPTLTVVDVVAGHVTPKQVSIVGPIPVAIPTGEVIVPLTRTPDDAAYSITQGVLPNPPAKSERERPVPADVRPQVYPADPETRAQLQAVLSEFRAASDTAPRRPEPQ